MGATLLSIIFYLVQIKQGGTLVLPAPEVMKQLFLFRSSVGDNDESPERESIESFLYGYV
jgi:hypothetical protein